MLIWGQNKGNKEFFEDMGFAGLLKTHSITSTIEPRGIQYLEYLYDLLENPKRSGAYALNSRMFANAVRECLELYLCNRRLKFQKRRSRCDQWHARRRRETSWIWGMRFRTRRIYHPKRPGQKEKSFNTCRGSRPVAFSGVEGYHLALYEWALIVLPFFLKSSELSPELADYLGRSTFSMVSVRFPYLTQLAKVAISKYLMNVSGWIFNLYLLMVVNKVLGVKFSRADNELSKVVDSPSKILRISLSDYCGRVAWKPGWNNPYLRPWIQQTSMNGWRLMKQTNKYILTTGNELVFM